MPKVTDTYALAYACCDTILKELRRFPTIDLIRERIGVNSPNTIKKAMNDWTADFAKQYIDEKSSNCVYPDVPVELNKMVYQLWRQTVKEAEQIFAGQDYESKLQIERLQIEIEQQNSALVEADYALQQASVKIEDLNAHIVKITADFDSMQYSLSISQQRERELNEALGEQKNRIDQIITHQQHLQQQDQNWMQRRIVEERDLASTKSQDKLKMLEERLRRLNEHYDQLLSSQKIMQIQNKQLIAENSQLRAELSKAMQTMD